MPTTLKFFDRRRHFEYSFESNIAEGRKFVPGPLRDDDQPQIVKDFRRAILHNDIFVDGRSLQTLILENDDFNPGKKSAGDLVKELFSLEKMEESIENMKKVFKKIFYTHILNDAQKEKLVEQSARHFHQAGIMYATSGSFYSALEKKNVILLGQESRIDFFKIDNGVRLTETTVCRTVIIRNSDGSVNTVHDNPPPSVGHYTKALGTFDFTVKEDNLCVACAHFAIAVPNNSPVHAFIDERTLFQKLIDFIKNLFGKPNPAKKAVEEAFRSEAAKGIHPTAQRIDELALTTRTLH